MRANADEQAENVPDQPLDAATQAKLDAQLAEARTVTERYPTVADATKAGFILAGDFTPGAGAHYISMSAGASGFGSNTYQLDPAHPLAYIYDGTAPTSHIVGLMYGAYTLNAPDGFAGPNDHWHRHANLCIQFAHGKIEVPFPPDTDITKAQCDAVKGFFMRRSLWMVHTWVVPGWESPRGVFAHANLNLHCGDGTDNTDAVGFCKGRDN